MESLLSSFSETAATTGSSVDSDYVSTTVGEDIPVITKTENVLILSALEPNLTRPQQSQLTGISPEGIQ